METPRQLREFHNSIVVQWSEKGTEKTPDQPEELEELKTRTPRKAAESSGGLRKGDLFLSKYLPPFFFSFC